MPNIVFTIARFTLLEAMRARVAVLGCGILVVAFFLAAFLSQIAITETAEIQTVLLASFLRVAAVLLTISFVIFSQSRETTEKGTDLLVSLPVSRIHYYIGKLLGYIFIVWIFTAGVGVFLFFLHPSTSLLVPWLISLGCELSIVASAALFFAISLAQPLTAFASVIGFYLLSRSISTFQLIGAESLFNQKSISQRILNGSLETISAILPRLDMFATSNFLVGINSSYTLANIFIQSLVYILLISSMGMIDLHRKNF